jgi:DNA-binding NtrC family response regulator
MSGANILIVDDELIMRESLAGWIERDGHRTETAESGEEALEKLESRRFDIALVDIKMEGISGLDVLKHIKESDLDTAVIMITAYGSVSTAINAMKNGACDYLLKPFDPNELGIVIEKIIENRDRIRENLYLREERRERTRFESMIGQSEKMARVFDLIKDVAPMNATVLITGETGTGKGLAAKAIHASGNLSSGPFVEVNCGAIPERLIESEIFGHQKGAFTGASETRKGRLEMAHGGALFLDEIGEISMRMQIDLLRAIEDKVFYRVGGSQSIEVDFRVIAATNRNIEEAVKSGAFREDLYYRLNVIAFEMPPLRERKEDIPLLAESFLRRFAQETNKPVSGISRQALDEMMLYEWPGNVRELENAVERAVVIGKGAMIMPEDLPIFRRDDCLPAESIRLKDVEKEHIVKILSENSGNIMRSAKMMGIDRSTLYKKIKRYHIALDKSASKN